MARIYFFILLLVFSAPSLAIEQDLARSLDKCQHVLLLGVPKTKTTGLGLCRSAWASVNDLQAKIPQWTAHVVTPERAVGCLARIDDFDVDLSVPVRYRAKPSDYSRSGYDLGHMVPNGDMSWNEYAQYESFLMTNVAPQLPGFNRGIWKQLEDQTRTLSVQNSHSLLIYAGTVYRQTGTQIGRGRVVVPYKFYKIIVDLTEKKTYAFMFPHQSGLDNLQAFQTTVKEIEGAAGVEFPVLGDKSKKLDFPQTDSKKYTQAKRKHCAKN